MPSAAAFSFARCSLICLKETCLAEPTEADCIEVGRKCERSAIAGRLIEAPFCRCRNEASLYSLRPDAARLYAAVLPYEKVCCEGCRLRGAPPPTLEESERSWVVLMLYWCMGGVKMAKGDAGIGMVQMEMKELDEEGGLLEDVVALRSSEWLRWADDLFALDVEESLLRLRPRLPSGALPSLTIVPSLPSIHTYVHPPSFLLVVAIAVVH